jgi:hypothetical protein
VKDRPVGTARLCPNTTIVGFDDRAADRQAHPHTLGFGRKKRFKNAAVMFPGDPGTVIFYSQDNILRRPNIRSYSQHTSATRYRRHRLLGVHNQVEKDVLQLGKATGHRRQIVLKLQLQQYFLGPQFGAH